jgi:hypothetical protein
MGLTLDVAIGLCLILACWLLSVILLVNSAIRVDLGFILGTRANPPKLKYPLQRAPSDLSCLRRNHCRKKGAGKRGRLRNPAPKKSMRNYSSVEQDGHGHSYPECRS